MKRMHVIGGGSLNYVLDQYIANSLQIPVLAGPKEATAEGNILLQIKAQGLVSDIQEMRAIIARSENPKRYELQDAELWEEAYQKYLTIVN